MFFFQKFMKSVQARPFVQEEPVQEYKLEELQQYIEKEINVEFGEIFIEGEGDMTCSEEEEDTAHIRLKFAEGKETEADPIISEKCKPEQDPGTIRLPGYQGHPYRKEIVDGEIQSVYMFMTSGKKAKTKSMEIYIVKTKEGEFFLYYMG